ncbi:dynein light chain 2, cytoplasmic isoform X1 [Microcebus murinus]|uniref:dynein light chain 2, cytoplasmic isoform X1 n=1 Tax=Microcebus murinus TaxID=30608 RepID=UPI000643874F|nr:dynein light chain 2, cytoplasmic isoform X1 [Microcebus murinus]
MCIPSGVRRRLPRWHWNKEVRRQSKLQASQARELPERSFTMSDRKAVIKNADMSEDMQQDAVDCATQAMEKYNIEKDIAAYIKKEFDKKYNPTWHCIVGRNFGSYVTHETKHFIYFYLGQVAILLFKSG